jgi:peptide/nickel transport system permease protein
VIPRPFPAETGIVRRGIGRFIVGRAVRGALFVLIVSSAALMLTRLAPGDHLADFGVNPTAVAAERHRLGLDRPWSVQYADWLAHAIRLDFGTSLAYRRPVRTLVVERAANTALLGLVALAAATLFGLVAGTVSGGGQGGPLAAVIGGLSVALLSVPPIVTSFLLLLAAAVSGLLPVGGFPSSGSTGIAAAADRVRYLILPSLALALPLGASLERLQSRAIRTALAHPAIRAAQARGLGADRILWRHALRLSLPSVLSVYGLVLAAVLSGSFVVEVVMSWPGLGALMYEALLARDLFLVAGCAAAVSLFLTIGVMASDIALAIADPRRESHG